MFSNKSGLEASQKRGGNKADRVVFILHPAANVYYSLAARTYPSTLI